MANEIALKVRVDGTDRAVKNIDQLEKAITDLKEELKGTDIGSENFRRLSGELQKAQSQLKTFEKEFEGLEPQQKTEAFLKLGEGIAGAFAIATTALTAFGLESEEVEKAQLAVTQALTIAIGARQIAEAGLNLRIVANIVAQRAYNLAVTAGNVVTRTFFATIAANPIGAIVTTIAALSAGVYALVKAQEEQIDTQEIINDSLTDARKKTIDQEVRLKSLGKIVKDTTASEELRIAALNELKEILPQLSDVELENADAIEQVTEAIEDQIKVIQLRAQAEALSILVVEKTKELIELQTTSIDDNLSSWQGLWITIKNFGNPILVAQERAITSVTNKQEKQQEIINQINNFTKQYTDILQLLLVEEKRNEDAIDDTNKRRERQIELEKKRSESVKTQIKRIEELGKALTFNYGEPLVLKNLRELNEEIDQFTEKEKNFQEEATRLFVAPSPNYGDVFGEFYDRQRKALTNTITGDLEDFQNAVNETLKEGARLAELGPEAGGITIEAFVVLQKLVSEYQNVRTLIQETPDILDVLAPTGNNPIEFFNNLRKQLIANGQIVFKSIDGRIELLGEEERNVEDLVKARAKLAFAESEITRILRERLEEQVKAGKLTAEEANELAKTRTQSLVDLVASVTIQEEEIRGVLFETQQVQEELAKKQRDFLTTENDAYKQYVLNNLSSLTDFYLKVLDKDNELFDGQRLNREEQFKLEKSLLDLGLLQYKEYFRQRKIDAEDLEKFNKLLIQSGIFLEDLSAEERIKILDEFYKKKKELRDKDSQEENDKRQEFIDGFSDSLRQVAQVSQTGVQVFQQYVQTQLTILQETENRILDQIVGDNEEAEKKRTEIREKYENERKQITKRGQLAQLELTRLQAIANVAESITKAFAEGPIIGQVLAGISAAIGAFQVGVITTQIAQVRNLRQGGLLFGASHEQGGIPLGNTGVFAEGGEVVINRQSSVEYRDLLSSINMAGGGRPIVSQPFDDSRLIEALTKTTREPIRAYVLEQDITEKQGINKRLQQLSKI